MTTKIKLNGATFQLPEDTPTKVWIRIEEYYALLLVEDADEIFLVGTAKLHTGGAGNYTFAKVRAYQLPYSSSGNCILLKQTLRTAHIAKRQSWKYEDVLGETAGVTGPIFTQQLPQRVTPPPEGGEAEEASEEPTGASEPREDQEEKHTLPAEGDWSLL